MKDELGWGTLYLGVKCPRGQDTVPTVSCPRRQDKPGGDILPRVQDTGGGGVEMGNKINRYTRRPSQNF